MLFKSKLLAAIGLLAFGSLSALSKEVAVEWTSPLQQDTLVVNLGDSLHFEWPEDESHTVWQMDDLQAMENCNFEDTSAQMLSDEPGYVWNPEKADSYYFTCDVGDNCESGNMKLHVIVLNDTDGSNPAPTPSAPSPAPSEGDETPAPAPTDGDGNKQLPKCSAEEQAIYLACVNTFAEDESACLGTTDLGGKTYGCSWCAQGEKQGCYADIRCRLQGNVTEGADLEDIDAKKICQDNGGVWIPGQFKGGYDTSPASFTGPSLPLTIGAVLMTLFALFH